MGSNAKEVIAACRGVTIAIPPESQPLLMPPQASIAESTTVRRLPGSGSGAGSDSEASSSSSVPAGEQQEDRLGGAAASDS